MISVPICGSSSRSGAFRRRTNFCWVRSTQRRPRYSAISRIVPAGCGAGLGDRIDDVVEVHDGVGRVEARLDECADGVGTDSESRYDHQAARGRGALVEGEQGVADEVVAIGSPVSVALSTSLARQTSGNVGVWGKSALEFAACVKVWK